MRYPKRRLHENACKIADNAAISPCIFNVYTALSAILCIREDGQLWIGVKMHEITIATFALALLLAIPVLIIVAWIISISELVKIAKLKEFYREGAMKLWLIGIFTTPILLGVLVAALPNGNGSRL